MALGMHGQRQVTEAANLFIGIKNNGEFHRPVCVPQLTEGDETDNNELQIVSDFNHMCKNVQTKTLKNVRKRKNVAKMKNVCKR